MKKGLKITLAIVISVLMVVTCGITVWAATADQTNANNGMVARIGAEGTGTYYATLEEAFSNASNGDTITVIADTTTTESITVTNKLTLTSENGSKVTLKSVMGALNVKGDNADLQRLFPWTFAPVATFRRRSARASTPSSPARRSRS